MNIGQIVKEYLKKNGFTGLVCIDSCDSCGCKIDDLFPCGSVNENCEPGYKVKCRCKDHSGWHIIVKKPKGIKKVTEKAHITTFIGKVEEKK